MVVVEVLWWVVGGGMGCDDGEGCGAESEGSTGSDMDSWVG